MPSIRVWKTPVANFKAVTTLCELEADLSKIPKSPFEKKENSKGQKYYRIDFNLVLTPTSAYSVLNSTACPMEA